MGFGRLKSLAVVLLAGCTLFTPIDDGDTAGVGPSTPDPDAGLLDGGEGPASSPLDARVETPDGAPTSRYAVAILADNPIFYMRFSETSGTVAQATKGVDGTYSLDGVTLGVPGAIAGDPDPAITFTSGSGYVKIPSGASFDGKAAYSVELWAKPSVTSTGNGFLVDHQVFGPRLGWTLRVSANDVTLERWNETLGPGKQTSVGTTKVLSDDWHYIVGTFDGSIQRLYVDTSRVDAQSGTIALPTRAQGFKLGHQNVGGSDGNSFRGSLDEVAIYDQPLTEAQIKSHYAAAQ